MDQTYQLKLALLRKAAIAADAVVRSHTPGTVPNATSEQMQTAKLYMSLAVPGFILALFDEIELLTVNRGFLLADLQEAATTLRRYETLHRAKGTDESTAKAEVNAELAARFESTIKAVMP